MTPRPETDRVGATIPYSRKGADRTGPRSARALFGGVEELATLVTDWIVAGFAGYWAVALVAAGAMRGETGMATLIWGAAFAATALAAAAGGLVHGFQRRIGPRYAQPLWRATLHLVTLANAAMLMAAVLAVTAGPIRTVGLATAAIKLLVATTLLVRAPKFRIVLVDHAITLAIVLALQGAAWWVHGSASAPWIVAGVAVSGFAGALQALRIVPHPRFNHNDLYHVVQIGALWLLYRGGFLLAAA